MKDTLYRWTSLSRPDCGYYVIKKLSESTIKIIENIHWKGGGADYGIGDLIVARGERWNFDSEFFQPIIDPNDIIKEML